MDMVYYSSFNSPLLGKVFVASTEKGVYMVDFLKTEKTFLKELRESFSGRIVRDDRKNRDVLNQLKKYLKGELRRFDCKLDFRGTAFQRKVWSALVRIPYGHTRSYGEIAQAIGQPKACRAVGNANGKNSIPLIVPCHRVIGNDGGLVGFGQGVRVKKLLLDLERAE
jgi:O-6-methylguanine DNA methyltransferase